ncbi:MAG: hypothetical protein H6737_24555 [Alphaproteobacteria bacterium]|nr:hypothetical protein [Alphaproteobacteria bacterium]
MTATALESARAELAQRLVSGGDHRQVLDPRSGLSSYLVGPSPRKVVPLGSCTASTPSVIGFEAARLALHDAPEAVCAAARERLAELLAVPEGCAIALTPSGTDAMYLVSALCLRHGDVHHVLVGSREVGGGTPDAAAGRAFSKVAPHGPPREVLPGISGRCTVAPVPLREASGAVRDAAAVERDTRAAIRNGRARGAHVVLNVVTHSKTGLSGPNAALVEEALRMPGVTVLIDAAQGRVEPHELGPIAGRGAVVLFTGSKFWGGPPFAGALVLPPALAGDPGALPEGLHWWSSAADLPPAWVGARAGLAPVNPGLGLRWAAALGEIEHTLAHGWERREEVLAAMERATERAPLSWVEAPTPRSAWLSGFALGRTIRAFHVPVRTKAEATALHTRLDRAGWHLGQPVALGGSADRWCLRIALGAPLLRERAAELDAGLAWFGRAFARIADLVEGPA